MKVEKWSTKVEPSRVFLEPEYKVASGATPIQTSSSENVLMSTGSDSLKGYLRVQSYKRRASSSSFRMTYTIGGTAIDKSE